MAFTSGNDVNILQATDTSFIGAGLGNDKYILSGNGLSANQTINITDSDGTNTLQLIGGLTIAGSKVTSNAIQLILSNGATVNVSGANTFSFEVGGDPLSGVSGNIQTFAQFVTSSLGLAAAPTSTSVVVSGANNVGVNSNGSVTAVAGPIVLTPGTTAPVAATSGADVFSFNVAAAKGSAPNTQITITGFTSTADSLIIDTITAKGSIKLSALNGVDGIAVQTNGIDGSTTINFGADANGDVIVLTLTGVTDQTLVQLNLT